MSPRASWRTRRRAHDLAASSALLAVLALVAVAPAVARAQAVAPAGAEASAPVAAAEPGAPRPLHLADAVRVSLERHPALAQARAQVRVAEAQANRALSPLLPQLSAAASYQRQGGAARGGFTPAATNNTGYDYFSVGVTLDQLLYDFDQARGRWRAAEVALEARRASERDERLNLVFNVKSAYFQAFAQRTLVDVAHETLDNRERHVLETQGFVEVGTRAPIDLVQAEADRESDRLALVTAENGYALGKAQLAAAIGLEQPADFEVVGDAEPPVPGEDDGARELFAQALAARPDVQAALKAVDSDQLVLSAAKGGYGPTLSASASAGEAGGALDALRFSWSVGGTLAWQIFEGGATRANVAEAEANVDLSRAQLAALRQQVLLTLEQGRLGLRAAKQSLLNAERLVALSRERLSLAEGQYQTGVGTMLALSDAQVALSVALGQRVQATYDVSIARAQLRRALGQ
jgi:outer membrane protein